MNFILKYALNVILIVFMKKGNLYLQWKYQINNNKEILSIIEYAFKNEYLQNIKNKKKLKPNIELLTDSYLKSNGNYIIIKVNYLNPDNVTQDYKECKINIKETTCDNCARVHGKRYDAIIQLRKSPLKKNNLDEVLKDIEIFVDHEHKIDPQFNITYTEKRTNGFDIFLSKKLLLDKIKLYLTKKSNFIIKTSYSLVGKNPNDNSDLYRTTLLLRTLPIEVNDIIEFQYKRYIVKKIFKKNIQLECIDTKKISNYKFSLFEKRTFKLVN